MAQEDHKARELSLADDLSSSANTRPGEVSRGAGYLIKKAQQVLGIGKSSEDAAKEPPVDLPPTSESSLSPAPDGSAIEVAKEPKVPEAASQPPPAAKWNDLPSDQENWCPADVRIHLPSICGIDPDEIDGLDNPEPGQAATVGNWHLLAASRRGKSHAHDGRYREDAYAFETDQESFLVGVVSDGAGSAKLSRIGSEVVSRIVCREIATWCRANLGKAKGVDEATALEPALMRAMKRAVYEAKLSLTELAAKTGLKPQDFRATLLLALLYSLHGRERIFTVHVGDGAMVGVRQDSVEVYSEIQTGEYGGLVDCFVPDTKMTDRSERIREIDATTLRAVYLCTDGIDDPFYPIAKFGGQIFLQLCHGVTEVLPGFGEQTVPGPILDSDEAPARIKEWLKFEKRGENDDRTIMVWYRSPVGEVPKPYSASKAAQVAAALVLTPTAPPPLPSEPEPSLPSEPETPLLSEVEPPVPSEPETLPPFKQESPLQSPPESAS